MAFDPLSIIVLFGITVVLGYIGYVIFDKTKVPDVIWLLLFGLLVGPVFHLVDMGTFASIAPLLSALALMLILFDAGLNMDFFKIVREIPRSTLLSVLAMALSVAVVTFLAMLLFSMGGLEALLLGVIISGTSSPIVLSIVSRLNIREEVKTVLGLESIISDPVIIVVAVALMNIMTFQMSAGPLSQTLAGTFSLGAVTGFLVGLVWLLLLRSLRGRPFDYMLTLAMLLLLYAGTEIAGGSGVIAALIFGLTLGNGPRIGKLFRVHKLLIVEKSMKIFQKEIAFFIRSFFFVFIGIIMVMHPLYMIYGALISVMLILARVVAVQFGTIGMKLTEVELNVTRIMCPRGLSAAVLAGLPLAYGIANGEVYLNVAFVTILITVIFTTLGTRIFYKPPAAVKKEEKKEEKEALTKKEAVIKEAKRIEKIEKGAKKK